MAENTPRPDVEGIKARLATTQPWRKYQRLRFPATLLDNLYGTRAALVACIAYIEELEREDLSDVCMTRKAEGETMTDAERQAKNKELARLALGWEAVPTSCRCGGSLAWVKPTTTGAQEMVGCVCHHTPDFLAGWSAMGLLIDAMRKRPAKWVLHLNVGWSGWATAEWCTEQYLGPTIQTADAETTPEAVAEAALMALKAETKR
jgi:hypothetical protein